MSVEKFKIHISEPIDPEVMSLLAEFAEIDVAEPFTPREEIYERIKDAVVYISNTDSTLVDKDMIDAAPKLRHIARHGSGYNCVDVDYATSKGILVTNAAGGNAVTMGEFTMCLMLCAARKVLPAIDASRRGHPDRTDFNGFELMGKTLGIVGVGNIGREVAKRAQVFGMKTIGCDVYPQAGEEARSGIILKSFEEVLKESDVITIHVPYNKDTHHMFSTKEFNMMKPGSIILNMARGGIVNEQDLIAAVNSKHLAGAALDVSEEEPISASNPLLHTENILYVPHIGGQTPEAYANISRIVADEIMLYAKGKRPNRVINPEVLK